MTLLRHLVPTKKKRNAKTSELDVPDADTQEPTAGRRMTTTSPTQEETAPLEIDDPNEDT